MAEDKPQQGQTQHKSGERTQEQRIADLELQLAATRAGTPGGTIPWHGAGPEDEIAETWSQAEQEAERAADNADAAPKR